MTQRKKRMPRNVIPFQVLAAITTKLYSHTLLLHKIPSIHIYEEMNTAHLLEGSFVVRCNGKWCQTFPSVALKQCSSFSKTQKLVQIFFFPVKSINKSLLLYEFKIGKEIFCSLPREISKYYFHDTFYFTFYYK